MTSPNTHALAIRDAIDRNSSLELGEALLAARLAGDVSWQTALVRGYTCWSKAVTNRKRSKLLQTLLLAGINPAQPIALRHKSILPISAAVRHCSWGGVERLLACGASLGQAHQAPGLFWDFNRRWFSPMAEIPSQLKGFTRTQQEEKRIVRREKWRQFNDAFWKAGFLPCPRMLAALMMQKEGGHVEREGWEEVRLPFVARTWAHGVRPHWEDEHDNYASIYPSQLANALPAMVMFLQAPEVHASVVQQWLEEALQKLPPTIGWVKAIQTYSVDDHPTYLVRLLKLVEILRVCWQGHAWSESDWSAEKIQAWEGVLPGWKGGKYQIRLVALSWSLDSGFPRSQLLSSKKHGIRGMFRPNYFHSSDSPLPIFALNVIMKAELRLETPIPQEPGETVGSIILAATPALMKRKDFQAVCRRYKQLDLDRHLPSPQTTVFRSRF